MSDFENLTVYITALCENVPQLLLNLLFLFINFQNIGIETGMSMATSIFSIANVLLQYYWNKELLTKGNLRYQITLRCNVNNKSLFFKLDQPKF